MVPIMTRLRPILCIFLTVALLAGCAATDYRNIRPRNEVLNAPIPVPWPKSKPSPPAQAAPGVEIASANISAANISPASASPAHTVRAGDTVYAIARQNGVEVRDIILANGLRAPFTLAIGQRLTVPVPTTHIVARGETTYSISRRYGVDLSTLSRVNGLKPPFTISIDQILKIPASATRVASVGNIHRPLPSPPPRQSGSFLWPIRGKIISSFGPRQGGLHNDGINIRARGGAPVRAAEAGVVAYAGEELKGFGKLLLIRHQGGWITAYAHNSALLVGRGDTVRRGQTIARTGATGSVNRPQLHFEIRKGTVAVDPQKYLSGS